MLVSGDYCYLKFVGMSKDALEELKSYLAAPMEVRECGQDIYDFLVWHQKSIHGAEDVAVQHNLLIHLDEFSWSVEHGGFNIRLKVVTHVRRARSAPTKTPSSLILSLFNHLELFPHKKI